jgi:hypothetical protein
MHQIINKIFRRFDKKIINHDSSIKNGLVCYLLDAYDDNAKHYLYSNRILCRIICEVLLELGYNVELNSFDSFNRSKYDMVIGFGKSFHSSCADLKILLYTEAHYHVARNREMKNLNEFNAKYKLNRRPERAGKYYSEKDDSIKNIISIGTEYSFGLPNNEARNILNINAPIQVKNLSINTKVMKDINKIIMLSGAGFVHKGIWRAIEAFEEITSMELNIFGYTKSEAERTMGRKIKSDNIIFHGWMRTDDVKFKKYAIESQWTISLSCSEGQSTAILECMSYGCIPIVTNECGIAGVFSSVIVVDNGTDLLTAINDFKTKNNLIESTRKCIEETSINNSYDQIKSNIKGFLWELM